MSILFSFDQRGGFYFYWGYTTRLRLGGCAMTFVPEDNIFNRLTGRAAR